LLGPQWSDMGDMAEQPPITQARYGRPERILLIDDGGPAALAATLLCPHPERLTLLVDLDGAAAPNARLAAIRRKADLLGCSEVIEAPRSPPMPKGPRQDIHRSIRLLEAGGEGLSRGCDRVIWPIQAGDDFEAMCEAADRARLASHLLNVDAPPDAPISLDAPLLDLADRQLAELLDDLDAPLECCWWCDREPKAGGRAVCGRCPGCERWSPLLGDRLAKGSARGRVEAAGAAATLPGSAQTGRSSAGKPTGTTQRQAHVRDH